LYATTDGSKMSGTSGRWPWRLALAFCIGGLDGRVERGRPCPPAGQRGIGVPELLAGEAHPGVLGLEVVGQVGTVGQLLAEHGVTHAV